MPGFTHAEKLRRGFTLIELLVVISIISLLIAMLLPALRNARHAANRTLCGVRIRSAGIGFLSYLEDHKQWTFLMRIHPTGSAPQSPRWEPSVVATPQTVSTLFPQDHPSGKIPTTSYMRQTWGSTAARHCPDLTPQALGWDATQAETDFYFGYAAPLLLNEDAGGAVMMDRRSSHYVRLTPGRGYGNRSGNVTAAQAADLGSHFRYYDYDPTETVPLLTDWLQNGTAVLGEHRTAPHNMNVAYARGIKRIDSVGAWAFFLDGTTEWREFPESARSLPINEHPSLDPNIAWRPDVILGKTTDPGITWTTNGNAGHQYYFPVRRLLKY